MWPTFPTTDSTAPQSSFIINLNIEKRKAHGVNGLFARSRPFKSEKWERLNIGKRSFVVRRVKWVEYYR